MCVERKKKLPSFGRKVEEANERMAGFVYMYENYIQLNFAAFFVVRNNNCSLVRCMKIFLDLAAASIPLIPLIFPFRKWKFYVSNPNSLQSRRMKKSIFQLHFILNHFMSYFWGLHPRFSPYPSNLFTIYNKLLSTNVLELFHHLHLKKS